MKENLCLTSKDVILAAMKASNKKLKDFQVDPNVMIIFSGSLLTYLKEKAKLKESEWLLPFHPYGGEKYIGASIKIYPLQ